MGSIVRALINRELNGKQQQHKTNLNVRIKIEDIIPQKALLKGHVIMGFSPCGLYVISYSVRPTNNMQQIDDDECCYYKYKLYFWSFIPFRMSRKLRTLSLFDKVPDLNLQISFLDQFIIVFGRGNTNENNTVCCYLTVTNLPNNDHTHTKKPLLITTQIELVPPYPEFDPQLNIIKTSEEELKILINTGSSLHQLELNTQNKIKTHVSVVIDKSLAPHYNKLVKKKIIKKKTFFKRQEIITKTENVKTIYDEIEEDDKNYENYKSFRRRKLADKKYEFKEENVLKQRNSLIKKKKNNKNVKCLLIINKNYALESAENNSTTTDDYYNNCSEPVALPVHVYLDNHKLSTNNNTEIINNFKLSQIILDIEVLSNEICNLICMKNNVQFNFLIDFDCHIVDNYFHNNYQQHVLCFVDLFLKGFHNNNCELKKVNSSKFETGFVFLWDKKFNQCRVYFDNNKLDKVTHNNTTSNNRRKKFRSNNKVYVLEQDLLWEGTSVDELSDPTGMITLYKNNSDLLLQ